MQHDLPHAEGGDDGEPDKQDGAKYPPDAAGSLMLNGKKHRQNATVTGMMASANIGVPAFRPSTADSTLIAGVMMPSPNRNPAPSMSAPSRTAKTRALLSVFMQQAVKREDAAFAVAVGAQHEDRVFEADDERQRPYRERDAAKHVVRRRGDMRGAVENLIDGVKRRGADVAKDHTDRADGQRRLAAARGRWKSFGAEKP